MDCRIPARKGSLLDLFWRVTYRDIIIIIYILFYLISIKYKI
jgi:hypothetical protein